MSKRIIYTPEQIREMECNQYTHSISPNRISFTLEFKKFFASQLDVPGMTTPKILRAAGYDPSYFSRATMDWLRKQIRAELASPEGLKPPRGLSREEKLKIFAEKDLSEQKTDASIKEIQERIVHLEHQINFLKKISDSVNRE